MSKTFYCYLWSCFSPVIIAGFASSTTDGGSTAVVDIKVLILAIVFSAGSIRTVDGGHASYGNAFVHRIG